jgi:hypothetical protein
MVVASSPGWVVVGPLVVVVVSGWVVVVDSTVGSVLLGVVVPVVVGDVAGGLVAGGLVSDGNKSSMVTGGHMLWAWASLRGEPTATKAAVARKIRKTAAERRPVMPGRLAGIDIPGTLGDSGYVDTPCTH